MAQLESYNFAFGSFCSNGVRSLRSRKAARAARGGVLLASPTSTKYKYLPGPPLASTLPTLCFSFFPFLSFPFVISSFSLAWSRAFSKSNGMSCAHLQAFASGSGVGRIGLVAGDRSRSSRKEQTSQCSSIFHSIVTMPTDGSASSMINRPVPSPPTWLCASLAFVFAAAT